MDKQRLVVQLQQAEGLNLTVTQVAGPTPVVGYGHKVTASDHLRVGEHITLSQAHQLLVHDVYTAVGIARAFCRHWDMLPEVVQLVLSEIAFAEGRRGLFPMFMLQNALDARDWPGAVAALRNSLLYAQQTTRYERLARVLEGL